MFRGVEMYDTIRADLNFKDLTKMLPQPRYSEKKINTLNADADTKIKQNLNLFKKKSKNQPE